MHVNCLLPCLARGRFSINGSYLVAAAAIIPAVIVVVAVTVAFIAHGIENENMA